MKPSEITFFALSETLNNFWDLISKKPSIRLVPSYLWGSCKKNFVKIFKTLGARGNLVSKIYPEIRFGRHRETGFSHWSQKIQKFKIYSVHSFFFIRIMILSGWESFGHFWQESLESPFFKIRIIGQNKHHWLSNYNNSYKF